MTFGIAAVDQAENSVITLDAQPMVVPVWAANTDLRSKIPNGCERHRRHRCISAQALCLFWVATFTAY